MKRFVFCITLIAATLVSSWAFRANMTRGMELPTPALMPVSSQTTLDATSDITTTRLQIGMLMRHLEAEKLIALLTRPLYNGLRGNDVAQLQRFLRAYGTYQYHITGYFGSYTKKAVIRFQKNENVDARGIVGPATRQKIMDLAVQTASQSVSTQAILPTPGATPNLQPLQASIHTAIISDSIDETGKTTNPQTSFASTTPSLWATLSLENAKRTTALSYIRYYQDVFLDAGTTHPSADGISLSHLQWSLKPDMVRTVGTYRVIFYVDGAKAETLTYSIF